MCTRTSLAKRIKLAPLSRKMGLKIRQLLEFTTTGEFEALFSTALDRYYT